MAKVMCLIGCFICLLVFLFFLMDISAGFPFERQYMLVDIVMMLASLSIVVMGWMTYREQDK